MTLTVMARRMSGNTSRFPLSVAEWRRVAGEDGKRLLSVIVECIR